MRQTDKEEESRGCQVWAWLTDVEKLQRERGYADAETSTTTSQEIFCKTLLFVQHRHSGESEVLGPSQLICVFLKGGGTTGQRGPESDAAGIPANYS